MTTLVIGVLGFFFAYAIYIAALTARRSRHPEDYLDGGASLPAWCFLFAGPGIVVAAIGLHDHFMLLALSGLQYNHVTLGLIVAALTGVLVQKRLWLASRITGHRTLGQLLGAHFGSTALRVLVLLLVLVFTVPLAAGSLSRLGGVVAMATDGEVSRVLAVWACGFFLFLGGVIGGWRAMIYVIGAQSALVLVLFVYVAGTGAFLLDWLAVTRGAAPLPEGVLAQAIPGVMQYSAGVGKEAVSGGIWTTTAVLSEALAWAGIILSPGFVFLGITMRSGGAFAFKQVWLTAGLAAGTLLLLGPLVGAGLALAEPAAVAAGSVSYGGVLAQLAAVDYLLAAGFVLLLAASLQIAISFFVQSGASLFVIELLGRYLLPELSPRGRRLAGRICVGVIYLVVALVAAFVPLLAETGGSLALALAAQLLPAVIGLCWVRWISRSAVLAGLVFGIVLVVFTEPLGLVLFESLFVKLPWGRWPLTIHSAAWGLAFNVAACLLVSIFTARDAERERRDRLHDVFARDHRQYLGGSAARAAKWSLILIWAFFALGPGAILGNWFFSQPVFTDATTELLLPSLWIWQISFWLLGVFLVWWLAYKAGMSTVEGPARAAVALEPPVPAFGPRTPRWLAHFLQRVAER